MSELTVGQLKGLSVNNNTITVPSGHTLYSPGHVIQVVTLDNTSKTAQGFSSLTPIDISNMSIDITPKSSTSKILIQARWFGEFTAADRVYNSVFYVTRNGTKINTQSDITVSGLTMASLSYEGTDADSTPETASMFTTDSPATVSTVNYKLAMVSNSGGTIYTNRAVGAISNTHELGTSGMILMEIAQ
jgi:hypothetical protein